jgi:hypothetical protein
MDARELDPTARPISARVTKVVATWLVALLAIGLWQGYGPWLLDHGLLDGPFNGP